MIDITWEEINDIVSKAQTMERERIIELLEADIDGMCEELHDAYERAAIRHGWETQKSSRVPWAEVPEANKNTMRVAVIAVINRSIALIKGEKE